MASVYSDYTALGLSFSNDMKDHNSGDSRSSFEVEDVGKPVTNSTEMSECSCNLKDVIILAEFSEVKGPIPLLTVPITTYELGEDLDDFILKIMAVDYQVNTSGSFRFTADTQVLQTDVIEGVHAYVHYFTLNDIAARGFVRPMCLAYISKNRTKLESKLDELRTRFLQVSDAMKEENRVLFLEEVSLALQQLKDVQYRYFQWKQRLEEEEGGSEQIIESEYITSINLDQLVDQQNEYNKILQSARSVLENTHLCESLSPWKDSFSVSDIPEVEQYISYVKMTVGNREPLNLNQRRGHATSALRPIAALSPFGVAIGVWYLCQIHSQFESCNLELRGACFWEPGESEKNKDEQKSFCGAAESTKDTVCEALSNDMYLQLLLQLLPAHVTIPYGEHPPDVFAGMEGEAAIQIVSGNEAGSSYYSALESTNGAVETSYCKLRRCSERTVKTKTVPPLETSFPFENNFGSKVSIRSKENILSDDDSSNDSLEYADSEVSQCKEFPKEELWCNCVWTGFIDNTSTNPGHKILQFFQTFSKVAQHILFSLLTGRTVVIAGSNNLRTKVWRIISALVYFVPTQDGSKYLRWHKGILVSAHIVKYKVIGLCVPERLTVHDMISPRDKNAVTILDVNSKKIMGPAYSGILLAEIRENFVQNFFCAEALVLYLQAVYAGIQQKVYLFKALSVGQPQLITKPAKDVMLVMGVKGRDIDIINYLKNFIKL